MKTIGRAPNTFQDSGYYSKEVERTKKREEQVKAFLHRRSQGKLPPRHLREATQ